MSQYMYHFQNPSVVFTVPIIWNIFYINKDFFDQLYWQINALLTRFPLKENKFGTTYLKFKSI